MFKVIKLKTVIFIVCILILVMNAGRILKMIYPAKYMDYVTKYSIEYEIDPYLVLSVIKAESKFKPGAVSHKNAKGLMQITDPTAEWIAEKIPIESFKKEKLLTPQINIQMGCFYLSYLLGMYNGNVKNALAAYNAGHNAVSRWLESTEYSKDGKTLSRIPYDETDQYVSKVLNHYKVYQYIYNRKG